MNFNCQLRFEPKQDVSVHEKQTCFDFPKRFHVDGKKVSSPAEAALSVSRRC